MDRLLELVKKQQGDDVTFGTGDDDICQDPLGDATVVTGDKMMTGEIVTGDITSVTYDVTDVVGDVKFENADSVPGYQLSTAAGDVATASDEEVTEADDNAEAAAGDGTSVACDNPGVAGDVRSVADEVTAAGADITTVSAPQQAVGYSHDWYRIFLLGLRKACRLLETKQSATITAEGLAVISQLRGE